MHFIFDKSVYGKIRKFKKKIVDGVTVTEIISGLRSAEDVRALLMSERLISLPVALRDEVISMVLEEFKGRDEENVARFTSWALRSQEKEYFAAQRLSKKWSIETILNGVETFLVKMRYEDVAPDGNKYPDYVLDSQYIHLLSSLGAIFYLVAKDGIPYRAGSAICKADDFYKFVNGVSHYESLRAFVLEVVSGNNIPVSMTNISPMVTAKGLERFVGKCEYLLEWYSDDWRRLEIYRDLNYEFNYHHKEDVGSISSLMARSGAGRYDDSGGGFMHFDLSKELKFEREFKALKILQHLAPLYGDGSVRVHYKKLDFSLNAIVRACVALNEYAEDAYLKNSRRVSRGKQATVSNITIDQLLKALGISKNERDLVELLSSEISGGAINMDVPLFKADGGYVLIPSHVTSLCFEKVIDRILSRKDVFVNFCNGMKKGLIFERQVIELISSSGRKIYRINGQGEKGVPEIDGLFEIDSENIAVCEIKSSIKPEGRRDAYGFTENHLMTALEQLDVRFDFLSSVSPEKVKDYGISLQGKRLALFIITNHNYFLGLKVNTPKGRPVSVVDINYLRDVFVRNVIPTWELGASGKYLRREIPIEFGGHYDALLKPLDNLLGMRRDTIQFQEVGVGIYIYKSPVVDRRSYYPEELWRVIEG